MALPGKTCIDASDALTFENVSTSLFLTFGLSFSPPHMKSEPEEDFYHSPKHKESLKRERDEDYE